MSAESIKVASVPLYLELLKEKPMDWQEEQRAEEEIRHQETMRALTHAYNLGLPFPECMVLAHEAGIANEFYREVRL